MNIQLDNITQDGCFSIRKQNSDKENERRAFCPGQYDELEEYIPEYKTRYLEIADQVKSLWKPEIISAWQQKQSEIEIA